MKNVKNNGFILISVSVFTIILFFIVLLIARQINILSTAYKNILKYDESKNSEHTIFEKSIGLLQTGTPSESPANYKVIVGTTTYSVLYENIASDTWRVIVSTTSSQLADDLPNSF